MIQNDLEQDKAIHAKESQVLVCAGAGSGKTHVLTERVKYLLSEGVDPSSIVAITYTNMAAEEMTERLASSVDTSKLFIGTVHSFANKILSNSGRAYHILTKEIGQNVPARTAQWVVSEAVRLVENWDTIDRTGDTVKYIDNTKQ